MLQPFTNSAIILLLLFTATPSSYSSELENKSIILSEFAEVVHKTLGDLEISQGPKYSIFIEAEPKVIARISAKVKNGSLHIFSTGNFSTDKPIRLKVSTPQLKKIISQSSSDILVTNWKSNNIHIYIQDSGSINVQSLRANSVEANISGAGDITLAGNTSAFNAKIDGSGEIDATLLKCQTVTASLDGAGDINLSSPEKLQASISGSGNISYEGNPKLSTTVDGAGEIFHR